MKEIADQHGRSVTFMAKYDMGAAGSSFHLHSSLWDRKGAKPLFAQGTKSLLFGAWLGGQLAMAREFALFYAPSVNAYKRYQAGSFAPTRIVAGVDNRTCGFRLCGEGASFRVENRLPGADANPYLAIAATIAAGLHGVRGKLKAPKLYTGNARGRHPPRAEDLREPSPRWRVPGSLSGIRRASPNTTARRAPQQASTPR